MKTRFYCLMGFVFILSAGLLYAQGHGDPLDIASGPDFESFPQVEYDLINGQYLLVWEQMGADDNITDIYGQFLKEDGSPAGDVFVVCENEGNQWWPRLAFDPYNERFLVVFEDNRNGDEQGDIRGIFVASDGSFVDAPTSDADHTFGICTEEHDIYTCSVAYNFKDKVYLVIWGDNRIFGDQTGEMWGQEIYGQLVTEDGTLILPADPTENFPIFRSDLYSASVPDVTYNSITNEFFVVFGTSSLLSDMLLGYVLGQRVTSQAQLLNPDGTIGVENGGSVLPAMFVSAAHENGPDCLQSRVASRTGYANWTIFKAAAITSTEVQAVWKGMGIDTKDEYYNDVYGQRIGFVLENGIYVAKYLNLDGEVTEAVSNFAISLQPGWAWPPELAYNEYDDEFLVAWGDPRDEETRSDDMYIQRLWINDEEKMIFLADDRVATVTNTENIQLAGTHISERSPAGVAYSNQTNDFIVIYQTGAYDADDKFDLQGNLVYGSEVPSAVTDIAIPVTAQLEQNYPNPFNPTTQIAFQVKQAGQVKLQIFNVKGEAVAMLVNDKYQSGVYQVEFDASQLPSGIYFCQLNLNGYVATKKMILME